MNLQLAIFAVVVLIPLLINLASRDPDRESALSMAVLIIAIWGATRFLSLVFPEPENKGLTPLLDMIGTLAALGAWAVHPKVWKISLAVLFATQCWLAACFWLSWEIFGNLLTYPDYLRYNNILWLLELATVASPGARSVARRAFHRLRARQPRGDRMGVPT